MLIQELVERSMPPMGSRRPNPHGFGQYINKWVLAEDS